MGTARERPTARDPWPTDWSGPAPEPPSPPPDHSTRNLALFAVLMVGATVWFSLHLEPWLGEVLVVAGPLTVWALWKLLQSWLDWGGLGSRAEAGTKKLLARPAATEPLIVALGVMTLLFLTTSSIYLDGKGELEVEVLADGRPFLAAPLKVGEGRQVAGRPFFGRLSREKLQFVLKSPLYEPLNRDFWPWQRLRLEVPGDFELKRFHLLLLVPGMRLLEVLPAVEATQAQRFYLEIEAGGKTTRLDDLKFQTVSTGAPAGDLERLAESQPDESVRDELNRYLAAEEVPPDVREPFLNAWARGRPAPTPRLREGDKVKFSVGCEGRAPFHEEEIDVGSPGTQVHVIQVEQTGC